MYCAVEMVEAFCIHFFLYNSSDARTSRQFSINDPTDNMGKRFRIFRVCRGGGVGLAAGVINPDREKRSSRIMWKKKIRLHLSAYVDAFISALVEKSVLGDHRVSDSECFVVD